MKIKFKKSREQRKVEQKGNKECWHFSVKNTHLIVFSKKTMIVNVCLIVAKSLSKQMCRFIFTQITDLMVAVSALTRP